MGKKYIIELKQGETAYKTVDSKGMPMIQLLAPIPYTEPDMEQVRKEAYEQGRKDGKIEGQAEAWTAARKIALDKEDGGLDTVAYCEIFGYGKGFGTVLKTFTASEAIEKIRKYEQEKDRQARIEYNFDEIKDVLSTTMKECNVSLDDIAEVLAKMKESDNG